MESYTDAFTVSAPARICLFGEHQSYLGLRAVAVAVDQRVTIKADSTDSQELLVHLPGADEPEVIRPGQGPACTGEHGLLGAAVEVLEREKVSFPRGYRFRVTSQAPPGAGLADRSALVVAWVTALLRAANHLHSTSGNDMGRLASEAEALSADEPVGMIDAYVCSLGGKLHLDPGDPASAEPLVGAKLEGLVVGYPREPGEAGRSRRDVREQTSAAVEAIRVRLPSFDLRTISFDDAVPQLKHVSAEHVGILYAHLESRGLCAQAQEMLSAEFFDKDRLGEMLDEEHAMLRDYLGLSTDPVERVIGSAKAAGALGCRACGCAEGVVAYAPDRQNEVVDAIRIEGWEACIVSQAAGARLDAGALSPPWTIGDGSDRSDG